MPTDSIWDAKGDLAVGTGPDAAARLPVGGNGQLLLADSTQTTGVQWTGTGFTYSVSGALHALDLGSAAHISGRASFGAHLATFGTVGGAGIGALIISADDSDANAVSFSLDLGTYELNGSNATGALTWGGNTLWHAGNDGSGSGLDADTVDGAQLSTDGTLASNSDAKVPSEKAVKTYVDAHAGGNALGLRRIAKTAAYTVVSADAGATIDCTSGTFTVSFDPAATLGANFHVAIYNSGSGTITLDPNSTETIRTPSGSGATATLAQGQGLILSCDGSGFNAIATASAGSSGASTGAIGVIFDGGGGLLAVGATADVLVPYNCTITKATLLADQVGSVVVSVWADSYGSYPPTSGDNIAGSAPPTISIAQKSEDATLTGWTTAITAGTTLRFNVNSVSAITRATLILTVTKS